LILVTGGVNLDNALLSQRFKNFSVRECIGSSRLYADLALHIAEDTELLELSSNSREGQPVPNMLFAAVHYLLLSGSDHELKEYYPSISSKPRSIPGVFAPFRDFCRLYRDENISLLKSKLVQTNEVRRCAYLYPIFCYIYKKAMKPLSLIELGTSAGLQLLWDQYSYSYGSNEEYGNLGSNLHLSTELRKGKSPALLKNSPPIASKIGVDLHVNDLSNNEDYLWLKALIWPEHRERLEIFEKAVQLYNQNPVKLVEGDGVALLADVTQHISTDSILCIFHTHVANQMTAVVKQRLMDNIKSIGEQRDVFHLYNNVWDAQLHLDYFMNGKEFNEIIGMTEGHGRWFDWEL
jgi:hypothetical protein